MTTRAPLGTLDEPTLRGERSRLQQSLELQRGNSPALDLTRGKPAEDQLALSNALDEQIAGNYRSRDGVDVRNYGGLFGLPEIRELGAQLLESPPGAVLAYGNSSLTLMHLAMQTALLYGLWGDARRWNTVERPAVLAPVPGYDRHFALSEALGVDMVNVDMTASGPDMEAAERLVAADASLKGIWCVPKYANPTGVTYDTDTVRRLAALPRHARADDFVIFWDNAYSVHDIYDPPDELSSIWNACHDAGTEDHLVQFASTSKITFAGGGVAFLAASPTLLAAFEKRLSTMTIGPDKVNQLRHARFLNGRVREHMAAHAALLKPKFDLVQKLLKEGLSGLEIATWTEPRGGYFVTLQTEPGVASAVVALAASVGLKLTPAGATHPYGRDPEDRYVRIAPTYATLDELKVAMEILVDCVQLATIETRMAQTT